MYFTYTSFIYLGPFKAFSKGVLRFWLYSTLVEGLGKTSRFVNLLCFPSSWSAVSLAFTPYLFIFMFITYLPLGISSHYPKTLLQTRESFVKKKPKKEMFRKNYTQSAPTNINKLTKKTKKKNVIRNYVTMV